MPANIALKGDGIQFANGNIVDIQNSIPTSGTFTAGSIVLENSTSGRVSGWKRLVTGSAHVLGADWAYFSAGPTLGTAQNTTSGTAIDFTSIPSWVNKITASWVGGSTNGASNTVWRVGTSGGIVSTGYGGASVLNVGGVTPAGVANSTGIEVPSSSGAADIWQMVLLCVRHSANTWVFTLTYSLNGTARSGIATSSIALAGPLDRLRLTTVNGTDTFDAGSISILYE